MAPRPRSRLRRHFFYAHVHFAEAGRLVPRAELPERAVYVITGTVKIAGEPVGPGQLAVLAADAGETEAEAGTRLVMIGGAPLEAPRFIEWNFVASSRKLIEDAKACWRDQAFEKVPGETEIVPLPE